MRKTIALFITAGALLLWTLIFARPPSPHSPPSPPSPSLSGTRSAPETSSLDLGGNPIHVRAWWAADSVGRQGGRQLHLRVRADGRRPVDGPRAVALVLDRSGSMEGAPLEQARRAALAVANALGDDDWLAVVSYAGEATVDLPMVRLGDHRDRVRDLLFDLSEGGGTHLYAGLAAGRRSLARAPAYALRQIILLSDGHANQGLTDPALLAEMVDRGRRAGIGLSAVGVGGAFDRETLADLALAGGGRYHVASRPEELERVFLAEVDHLNQLVARGVEIRLDPGPEARLRPLDRVHAHRSRSALVLELGDLARGETKTVRLDWTPRPAHRGESGVDVAVVHRSLRGPHAQQGRLPAPPIAADPVAGLASSGANGAAVLAPPIAADPVAGALGPARGPPPPRSRPVRERPWGPPTR